ncbi:hypothetical protein M0805_008481 [Coniferiporia weirii]|nr:hypothetical protein M0805_008481 [Coniferiporia weirii]
MSSTVVLNSPLTTSPNHQHWDMLEDLAESEQPDYSHFPRRSSIPADIQSNSSGCSSVESLDAHAYVAPLSLKRRPRRKSLSLAIIDTGLDAAQLSADVDEDQQYQNQLNRYSTQRWQSSTARLAPPTLMRSQSLGQTQLPSQQGISKRCPRPLPPVPLSRPSSSGSSCRSGSSSPRPLPTPPAYDDRTRTPTSPLPTIPLSPHAYRPITPPLTFSPPPAEEAWESEPASPSTPGAGVGDLEDSLGSFSFLSSPRVPTRVGNKSYRRVHASPYKCARGARFSTTSLSSQVSVPPVPPPAEIRRRNRNKMAKLLRVLGESPPSHLVFREQILNISEEPISEAADDDTAGRPDAVPDMRGASLDSADTLEEETSLKARSDPDAGHGGPPQSPAVRSPPSPRVLRRPKRGRSDDRAARYVVSLADGMARPVTPPWLSFKLGKAKQSAERPKSAQGEGRVSAEDAPLLTSPPRLFTLDLHSQSQRWVHEMGDNRWEVDDYAHVVNSLRKL